MLCVSSGVLFTADPVTNNISRIVINANFGLGEVSVMSSVSCQQSVVCHQWVSCQQSVLCHQSVLRHRSVEFLGSFVWCQVRKISSGELGNFLSLGKFSLPSEIGCFLIWYYMHFRVYCSKIDFTNGSAGSCFVKSLKKRKKKSKWSEINFGHFSMSPVRWCVIFFETLECQITTRTHCRGAVTHSVGHWYSSACYNDYTTTLRIDHRYRTISQWLYCNLQCWLLI